MRALEGIRVLELAQVVSGPYGGMLLAELGANVIKVEAPDGDITRGFPTRHKGVAALFYNRAPSTSRSTTRAYPSRSARSPAPSSMKPRCRTSTE